MQMYGESSEQLHANKNKQERGGFMRKNLKKGIGTLLFCILIAESVTACGGPASSSTIPAKVDDTGTREAEEEVKVDEEDVVFGLGWRE